MELVKLKIGQAEIIFIIISLGFLQHLYNILWGSLLFKLFFSLDYKWRRLSPLANAVNIIILEMRGMN